MLFKDQNGIYHDSLLGAISPRIHRKVTTVKKNIEETVEETVEEIQEAAEELKAEPEIPIEEEVAEEILQSEEVIDNRNQCTKIEIDYTNSKICLLNENDEIIKENEINDIRFKDTTMDYLMSFSDVTCSDPCRVRDVVMCEKQDQIRNMNDSLQNMDLKEIVENLDSISEILDHGIKVNPSLSYTRGKSVIKSILGLIFY